MSQSLSLSCKENVELLFYIIFLTEEKRLLFYYSKQEQFILNLNLQNQFQITVVVLF